MLLVKSFEFNTFNENTYIIWEKQTNEAAVIDPGCYDESEKDELKLFISENNLKIKYLINTHCHIDHVLGVNFIKQNYKPDYFIPEADLPLHRNAPKQGELFGFNLENLVDPDEFLSESKKLTLGKDKLEPLFTPGHTPGEFCFYSPENKFCITGDVLFHQSIGRTDLWGGDYETLIESIQLKLLKLPDDTKIYPGHGIESTIGVEKNTNPFLLNI